ncbi:hypothetical protein [Niallia endozanthoxylica]|nr:hypothetical protein [Niallia endozanthoxylica]
MDIFIIVARVIIAAILVAAMVIHTLEGARNKKKQIDHITA